MIKVPKCLTFVSGTKDAINEEIELFEQISRIQALFCNTITPEDVRYTLEKLKERKKEL